MIVSMKRLSLVGLKDEEEQILKALQSVSAVQILHTEDASPDEAALQEAEGLVQRYNSALLSLKPYADKPSFLQPKPESSAEALVGKLDDAAEVSAGIETAERRKVAIRALVDKHRTQIDLLAPWREFSLPLDQAASTKHSSLYVGLLKADELDRLGELDALCGVEVYGGDQKRAVLIVCPPDLSEAVDTLLRGLDWTDITLPALPVSAADAICENEEQIAALEQEAAALEETLTTLGERRALIADAADAAVIERDRAFARNLLTKTESAFALEGWVRSDKIEAVEKAVAAVTDAFYLETREPTEEEIPPVVVKNGGFATPYESVTNLYSYPMPGSIDGTPLMAPWYFLLFGMMLSDTGYGILLALGTLIFIKKAKPGGMMGDLARVIFMGGISTIVWGVLIGTFFGMDWNVMLYGTTEGPFPLIVNPGNDPITMLFLCFGLGIAHIFAGVFIKIYMAFRDGDWQTAVFDNITWVLIIFGLLVYALGAMVLNNEIVGYAGLIAAGVGALTVLLMKGRGKRNPLKRLVSGAGSLYDITSYLSDVLSYARLFALGIATGVIGSVFNQLGGMIMGASTMPVLQVILFIVAIALLVFLHLFNLGINTLGTFVHCARLQYVEFYGKFYEVGGRPFRPLGYETRHNRVKS